MSTLNGKVAVVTGASKGIGAAIAKKLGALGATVVVNYASDKVGGERIASEITKAGGKAIALGASVSDEAGINSLFAQTHKQFGKIDILVNNAGVYGFSPVDSLDAKEWKRQYDTNVLGLLQSIKAAVPFFPAQGGSVINIGSAITQSPMPGSSVYAGTKGAVDVITRSLAKELGPRNIRVNSVNPGLVITEGVQTAGIEGSDFQKEAVAQTPLGRVGRPEDIAGPVAFLASEDAAWVTGAILPAAGGFAA